MTISYAATKVLASRAAYRLAILVALALGSCSSPSGADLPPSGPGTATPAPSGSTARAAEPCRFDDASSKFDDGCTFGQ